MSIRRAVADSWVDLLGSVNAAAAFGWAGAEGQFARRLGYGGPATGEVARFFSLDRSAATSVARQIAAAGCRNRALGRYARRRGLGAVESLVTLTGAERLSQILATKGPAILIVAPQGPRLAATAALHKLGATALVVADLPRQPLASWGFEVQAPGASHGQNAAIALKAAVDHLRNGGWVLAGFEGEIGPAVLELAFLGGTVALRPGVAVMARLGRAPVFPIAARWIPGDRPIEIEVHPHRRPDGDSHGADQCDRDLLTALTRDVENLVRDAPGQCNLRFLRSCLGSGAQSAAASRPDT